MKDNGIITELLRKYDLMLPVLKSEQKRILRSKKRTLAVILSGKKKSSFIISMAVRFYYMMRNAGLNAAPVTGFRAAMAAIAIIVIAATGGSLLFVQNYFHKGIMTAEEGAGLKGTVTAVTGDIVIQRGNGEIKLLKAKERILDGDVISTGNSSMFLQFGNGSVVKIMKVSTVRVIKCGESFNLTKGCILSRVPVLAAGKGYDIHTPDSIISVRGTEFCVLYKNSGTEVIVTNGVVAVKHMPSGKEYEVHEGNKSTVNAEGIISQIDGESRSVMNGFADLLYIESIDLKTEEELNAVRDKLAVSDNPVTGVEITLRELKEKYGRLDEVILYSGKKYTGVIISRGGVYKILTPGGIISVRAIDVKGSRVIQ